MNERERRLRELTLPIAIGALPSASEQELERAEKSLGVVLAMLDVIDAAGHVVTDGDDDSFAHRMADLQAALARFRSLYRKEHAT